MTSSDKIEQLVLSSLKPGEVFHLDLRPEWGSEHPQYRMEIRKGILEYLHKHFPDQVAHSIWDLDTPPVLKDYFVSISHCEGVGGFAFCSRGIGLDIEDTSRINPKIIDRVSSDDELKACPKFELLWPAKEAVFKCSTEFYTIGQIQISQWTPSQYETFSFTSLTANGWSFMDSTHSYAIAIKKA